MEYKTCTKCKVKKDFNEFSKNKFGINGLSTQCKKCRNEYYLNNKENHNARMNKWRKENVEYQKEYYKKYYEENKEKLKSYKKEYVKEKLKNDSLFKFKYSIRSLIKSSFKRVNNKFKKNSQTEIILGCTIDEFIKHIESQFTKGMTLENHGEWHLDHIIPLATADTEEDVIKLCHYTNYQPLWAKDNLSKSDKIIEKQLVLL
jgi:hypothetical protein